MMHCISAIARHLLFLRFTLRAERPIKPAARKQLASCSILYVNTMFLFEIVQHKSDILCSANSDILAMFIDR